MLEVFKKVLSESFDYAKALQRESITQEEIDRFREALESSEFVPKYIDDKQVNRNVTQQP